MFDLNKNLQKQDKIPRTAKSLNLKEYFRDSKHSLCNLTPWKVKTNIVRHCFLTNRNRSPIIFQMPGNMKAIGIETEQLYISSSTDSY